MMIGKLEIRIRYAVQTFDRVGDPMLLSNMKESFMLVYVNSLRAAGNWNPTDNVVRWWEVLYAGKLLKAGQIRRYKV